MKTYLYLTGSLLIGFAVFSTVSILVFPGYVSSSVLLLSLLACFIAFYVAAALGLPEGWPEWRVHSLALLSASLLLLLSTGAAFLLVVTALLKK